MCPCAWRNPLNQSITRSSMEPEPGMMRARSVGELVTVGEKSFATGNALQKHDMKRVGEIATSVTYDGGLGSQSNGRIVGVKKRPRTPSHHPGSAVRAKNLGHGDTQCRSARYAVDALGRRLAKTASGLVTTFVHDGAQVIDEYESPALASGTINAPTVPGYFSDNAAGTITLASGGTNISATGDQFRYAYTMLTGDGSITTRSVAAWQRLPAAW